jgi:mono/diheme cytochrome c family protein
MYERQIEPSSLGISRLLTLFAVMSVVFLLVLAIAPAKSQLREWRSVQQRYDELAARQGVTPPDVAIQQIWSPKLKVVDRCTTCHLGMGAAEPLAGDRLFAAHPPLPHDPADLGCTICHAGQGRATSAAAAHGRVKHWQDPMLETNYLEAGCGNCHTHLTVASPKLAERGRSLFVRYDCVACHVVGSAGRGSGPNLSTIGTRGVPVTWHERHLTMRASRDAPEWRHSYGEISAEDRAALHEYMKSLHGAPKLVRAKALAHELGCRGCHKINGIGGDDGPDLTNVGRKLEHDLDFTHVAGAHTRHEWLKQHFLAPDKVVPGSKMPPLAVTDEQAELLTLYMLSLRPAELPQESWPKDRILGTRFGARDFSQDGETLYGVFCAACHGPNGEGRRWANSGNFPAIGSRDFLAFADDELIRQTITHGRPGRRMPAWGTKDGGLSREEIDAIVDHVRSFAPGTPEPWGEVLPEGSAERGAPLFARDCSGCHGARGEGNIGPQLSNAAFLSAASDAFIARTIIAGRPSAGMRHFGVASVSFEALTRADVADVVAFIRALGTQGSQDSKKGENR